MDKKLSLFVIFLILNNSPVDSNTGDAVVLKPVNCKSDESSCPKGSSCLNGLCIWTKCLASQANNITRTTPPNSPDPPNVDYKELCKSEKDCPKFNYCRRQHLGSR